MKEVWSEVVESLGVSLKICGLLVVGLFVFIVGVLATLKLVWG